MLQDQLSKAPLAPQLVLCHSDKSGRVVYTVDHLGQAGQEQGGLRGYQIGALGPHTQGVPIPYDSMTTL